MTGQEQWVYVKKWIREDFEAHHAFPGALSTSIRKSENGPRASQANVLLVRRNLDFYAEISEATVKNDNKQQKNNSLTKIRSARIK